MRGRRADGGRERAHRAAVVSLFAVLASLAHAACDPFASECTSALALMLPKDDNASVATPAVPKGRAVNHGAGGSNTVGKP
jgi:hypothetical protein